MPLTDATRKENLRRIIVLPGTYGDSPRYLALSSTAPAADGTNITEPSGNGYQRISLKANIISTLGDNFDLNNPTYDSVNDKYSYTNIKDIYFYEATGSWGTLPYFAIFSSSTGGTVVAYGTLDNAISPIANTVPVIRTGDLTITEQ